MIVDHVRTCQCRRRPNPAQCKTAHHLGFAAGSLVLVCLHNGGGLQTLVSTTTTNRSCSQRSVIDGRFVVSPPVDFPLAPLKQKNRPLQNNDLTTLPSGILDGLTDLEDL